MGGDTVGENINGTISKITISLQIQFNSIKYVLTKLQKKVILHFFREKNQEKKSLVKCIFSNHKIYRY